MKKCLTKYLFIITLSLLSFNASANKWVELTLGAGFTVADNIRSGNKAEYFTGRYSMEPVAIVAFRLGPIAFSSEGAGLAIVYFKNFKMIPAVIYEGEPYAADGMSDRKRSIFAGGMIQLYSILIMGFQDMESRSGGKIFKVMSKPEFQFTDKWTFSPRLFYQYWDEKYINYYYGVGATEVDLSIGRTAYHGVATSNYGFMFRNLFKIGTFKYLFSFGMKFYGDGIYKSPTVIKKQEGRLVFGLIYDVF